MIKTITGLEPNTEIFVPGGMIRRSQFIMNSFIIMAPPLISGSILIFLAVEYFKQTRTDLPDAVFYNYFACCTPFVYFFYQNIFKRIRDYRGVNLNFSQKTGYFAISLIPVLNFYLYFRLLFSESCRSEEMDHKTSAEDIDNPTNCNVEKIDKLIKMKSEGHISDEEFAKLKDDVIKKAS